MCVCFTALYWFNYELVKAQLCEQSGTTQANFSISFTAGAVSGAVSTQPHRQLTPGLFFTLHTPEIHLQPSSSALEDRIRN